MASAATSPSVESSRRPRGATVSAVEVRAAADALLRAGERPSVDAVRRHLGQRGSPNRLAPLLADWYRDLGARVAKGPGAFDRIPAPAAQLLESLWLALAEEAQRRATDPALTDDRAQLDLRSQLLSQREGELHARLRDREALAAALEARAVDLDKQLARALADLTACRTRLTEVSVDRDGLLRRLATPRPRVAATRRPPKTARVAKKVTATARRKPAKAASPAPRRTPAAAAKRKPALRAPRKPRTR